METTLMTKRTDNPGQLPVTYQSISGPHVTPATLAPLNAHVEIPESVIRSLGYRPDGSVFLTLAVGDDTLEATASAAAVKHFGAALSQGNTVKVRGTLTTKQSRIKSTFPEPDIPLLKITEAELADADDDGPYELDWTGTSSKEIAEVLFWAADDGRDLIVDLGEGQKVRMVPQAEEEASAETGEADRCPNGNPECREIDPCGPCVEDIDINEIADAASS